MASDKALVIKAGRVQQIPDTDALLVGTDTGSSIDTATATVLGLGRANATSIDIGDVGVTTTIKGDLTVDGAEIVTGSTTLNGDVIIGDNFAADDLTITAGVLNDITFRENASHSILVGAGAAAGGSLSIVGGTTTTAATAGGDAKMTGGAGLTTGGGGNIVLTGGASPSGLPGNIAAVTTRTANGTGATDGAVLTLTQAAGSAHIWVGATSPNGTVSGTAGDLYMRTNGTLYVCTATGTTWAAVGTATVDLQSAYNAGNQIGIASATPVLLTNSSFTNANILEVTASQTGAGGGIAVSMGALTTGTGVEITQSGSGNALLVKDGASTVLRIDQFGAVTVTGNNNGTAGSAIQVTGGAGVSAVGGLISLTGGVGGTNSDGGGISITGGAGTGTGVGANASVDAGAGTQNGDVSIGNSKAKLTKIGRSGGTTQVNGGILTVSTVGKVTFSPTSGQDIITTVGGVGSNFMQGTSGSGDLLHVRLTVGGNSVFVVNRYGAITGTAQNNGAAGSDAQLAAGDGLTTTGGTLYLSAGNGAGSGGGAIVSNAGAAYGVGETGGSIDTTAGGSDLFDGGHHNMYAGSVGILGGAGGTAGSVEVGAGDVAIGAASGTPGAALFRGGDVSIGSVSGGLAQMRGGNTLGTGPGGAVQLNGGTAASGKPGGISAITTRTANGTGATDGAVLTLQQAAGSAAMWVGATSPNGTVSGTAGSLYLKTDGTLWLNTGGTTVWSQVATATGGAATLQSAYDSGATGPSATTILTTLADGGVQITKGAADTDVYVMKLTDAVAGSANDVLQISKTSAAAGFGASITMGASTTRAGLSISQAGTDPASRGATISLTGAGAGVGVLVAMGPGGQAVTGAGILSTMGTGSTGAAITATTAGVAAGSHAVSAAITGASSGNGVNVTLAAAATGRGINVSHAGTGAGASGLTVSMTNAAHTQAGALTAKGGAAAGTSGDAVVYVATTDTVAGTTGPALHVFGTKDHTGLYVQGQDGEAARITGSVGPALVVNAGFTGDALQVKDNGTNVITVDQFGVVTILGNNNGTIGSSVSMTGGAGVTGAGGTATLRAGAGGSASAGAVASVIGGAGGAATFAGGNVALTGGAGLTTGVGGDIVATGGASASGKPGHTQLVTTRTADGTSATDGPAATLTEAAGSASIWVGATNPNGTVTGTRGSLYLKNNDGTVYVNTDNSTGWSQLGTSTGSDVIVTGYVNGEAGTIGDGAPVCFLNAAGTAKVFFADSNGASFRGNCVGLANATALTTAPLDVLVGGEKDVPDAIWDAVPAAADVGTEVFLSENSGKLTITAPTTSGSIVQKIGIVSRGGSGAVRVIVQPAQGTLLT